MADHQRRVDFAAIAWTEHSPGLREKRVSNGGQTLRLVSHTHEHVENDWCSAAHSGVLISGRLCIEFDDETVVYEAGDVIAVPEGDRHRGAVARGDDALMLLIEPR